MSRGLKAIALRFHVPVLALSQLNDEGRVRESRAIEQDACSVIYIVPGVDATNPEAVEVQIKKNRFGRKGSAMMRFSGEEMWFFDERSWVPASERPPEARRKWRRQ